MNLFYSPDINSKDHTLDPEQSLHAVRVLRLSKGDTVYVTDGRGTLFTGLITDADAKKCRLEITDSRREYGKRPYSLSMAVAPTKNIDRYEWFLEKATEIGCDVFIPLLCERSERKVVKPQREMKVITSAVKQSLKAYHPVLEPISKVRELIARPFEGVRLIAHCGEPVRERKFISEYAGKSENVLILIGPEGDFSPEEINFAVGNGFREITLGDTRLRTETAALMAAASVAILNQ